MKISGYFPVITETERALPFYVATIGKSIPQEKIYRPKGISDYQLLFPFQGKGHVLLDHQEYTLEKGSLLYLTPHTPHDYYEISGDWITHWVTFSGTAAEKLLPAECGIFKIPDWEDFNDLFQQLDSLQRDENWLEKSTVLLYSLLIRCRFNVFSAGGAAVNKIKQQLLPVTNYLEKNYTEPVMLCTLAKILNVTEEQICRMFRAAYNIRPMEYLNLLRIQRAKELLMHKKALTISQISHAVGYDSPSYFCHLFKKAEHMTAAEYKKLF